VTPKAELSAIEALEKSKGWIVLRKVMEDEIVSAAMAIAENPNMSLDEINFRRGSIFAAKALLDMPTRLKSKLYGEVALNKDDTPAQPLA
tara:strand:- start:473 stop:742 length:270 start_codon:yes stop_codon:yes gene_type:complete